MEDEEYTPKVFVTIDDVVDDMGLKDLLEIDLGREPGRDVELCLAHEVAEYDVSRQGFVVKPGFGPDEAGSIDNWEQALAAAEAEADVDEDVFGGR